MDQYIESRSSERPSSNRYLPYGLGWAELNRPKETELRKIIKWVGRQRIDTDRVKDFWAFHPEPGMVRTFLIASAIAGAVTAFTWFYYPIHESQQRPAQPDSSPVGQNYKAQERMEKRLQQIFDTSYIQDSPTEKQLPSKTPFANLLFPQNYTPNMLATIRQRADEETKTFLKSELEAKLRHQNVTKWKPLIKEVVADPRLDIPINEQRFWEEIAELVMLVESSGDPRAESKVGGKGLMQIKRGTGEQTAAQLGITKFDVFNPKDNILLSLKHLLNLRRSFHSWELILAAYNLGEGNLINCMRAYLDELRVNPIEIERKFTEEGSDGVRRTATWIYGDKFNITLADLKQSPGVKQVLKKAGMNLDELDAHPMRVVASLRLVDQPSYQQLFGEASTPQFASRR